MKGIDQLLFELGEGGDVVEKSVGKLRAETCIGKSRERGAPRSRKAWMDGRKRRCACRRRSAGRRGERWCEGRQGESSHCSANCEVGSSQIDPTAANPLYFVLPPPWNTRFPKRENECLSRRVQTKWGERKFLINIHTQCRPFFNITYKVKFLLRNLRVQVVS